MMMHREVKKTYPNAYHSERNIGEVKNLPPRKHEQSEEPLG